MLTQIRLELFKLTRRGRSYLGFVALMGIAGLVVLGFRQESPFQDVSALGFISAGSVLNGGLIAWFLLRFTIMLFLPLFVCVIAGDLISGEAAEGTLRSMLTRPQSRGRLFVSKFITAVIYTVALTLFLGIVSYVTGAIFLGRGVLMTFQSGTILYPQEIFVTESEADGLMRLLGAYTFSSLSMLAVGSIAFFLSTIVTNSLGAIGGAMVVYIAFRLLGVISYFDPIEPYLLTTHIETFERFFVEPIPWAEIRNSASILLIYVAVFAGAGFIVFSRKDVLS